MKKNHLSSPPDPRPLEFDSQAYLHLTYWPTWIGIGFVWLLTRLPFDTGLRVGRGLGAAFYWLLPNRRKATLTNLALAFPELSTAERVARAKAVYKHVGMTMTETGWTWFRDVRSIEDRFSLSGEHHLNEALESDSPLILLQAHFSALEITGSYMGPRWPVGIVYDSPKNPMIAEWLMAHRRRRLAPLIDNKNIRKMIRVLRNGGAVWYSPDQCVSAAQGGIPTRFFDQPVLTSNGTARMVQMTKATVISMIPTRHSNGKSYHIAFFKPLSIEFNDEQSCTQAINDLFEKQVTHYPEQYLWLHKRFKPPPGDVNPYVQ